MSQSSYVWQRAWTDAVCTAVEERAPSLAGGMVVLGAEIAWIDGAPQHVMVALDHAVLARASAPTGLALRIGACPKARLSDPDTLEYILQVATEMTGAARAGGWEPAEFQLDFDSATSGLDGYRHWVESIAAALHPMPVTITVLPTWMSSKAFGPLVKATDGFVLQVHSVERADVEQAEPTLCDSAAALRWTEHAALYGVPFRVALPTYSYVAILDDSGDLKGLVAEAGSALMQQGGRVREVRADPHAMARLVSHWTRSRPEGMQGIIWYRLPVDGDRLNWAWSTLERVCQGESPVARLEVLAARTGTGLIELIAENRGDLDAEIPKAIEASWSGGASLLGADSLGGMEWERADEGTVRWTRTVGLSAARVKPGERRVLGWIRLTQGTEVGVHVVEWQR